MSLFGDKATLELIEQKNTTKELPRAHLGFSQIGQECERALFYYFRWCYEQSIGGQLNRLFKVGHDSEPKMVADLESTGVTIISTQENYSLVSGHFKGSSDGIAKGFIELEDKEEHVILEFKTSNDKNFKDLMKKGVKESKPVHFAQMQIYGYMAKVKKAYYLVLNKNNSQYYAEWITIDEKEAKSLIQKAELIITTENVDGLPKIGGKSWFQCKFCPAYNVCQNNAEYEVTCRTCVNADICDGGVWECGLTGKELTVEDQKKACSKYESIKGMAQ